MYVRSAIAVCLASLSLVESIPIMETENAEVYARGLKLPKIPMKLPSIPKLKLPNDLPDDLPDLPNHELPSVLHDDPAPHKSSKHKNSASHKHKHKPDHPDSQEDKPNHSASDKKDEHDYPASHLEQHKGGKPNHPTPKKHSHLARHKGAKAKHPAVHKAGKADHPAEHKGKKANHPASHKKDKDNHPADHKNDKKANHPAAQRNKGHPRKSGPNGSKKHSAHKQGKASPAHKSNKKSASKKAHGKKKQEKKSPQSETPEVTVPTYNPNDDPEAKARAANNARKSCQAVSDCHCPTPANKNAIHNTSCINGFCSCDNPTINLVGGEFIDAVRAIGNASITKAVSQLMQGIADATQVASTIAGAFLGPEAKYALKAALLTVPDTGPSHIDQASKSILMKVL